MITLIVKTGAGGEILEVEPDQPSLPVGAVRVTADPDMLRRVRSHAYLSIVSGELVLDEAAQAADRASQQAAADALAGDAAYRQLIDNLRVATPAQIGNWVDAQVTDVAGARAMFKRILLLLAHQLRK